MSTRSVPVGEIRPLGDGALLVGVADAGVARRLVKMLAGPGGSGTGPVPGVGEVVGGLATVMVTFRPHGKEMEPDLDAARAALGEVVASAARRVEVDDATGGAAKWLRIPTTFDGPDLAEVAGRAGWTTSMVIERLTARPLIVEAVGFSPGFAYLAGLPEELARVPRRAHPRPVVPAGSVALANGYAAVYPTPSPGGWQLIGRTGETLFSPTEPPYARLAPGDRVQFTVADPVDRVDPVDPAMGAAGVMAEPTRSSDRPVLMVEEPGLRTVFQDGGRPGLAAIGVPSAAPADPYSFEMANRLVGNQPDACALEVTARGPTLRCLRPTYLAVVGAELELRVDGRPVPTGHVVPLTEGQVLSMGVLRRGLRAYLAVAGGIEAPRLLGSSATDQLCGLGPPPLAAGDALGTGALRPLLGDHIGSEAGSGGVGGSPVTLRVVPGPHAEWFAPDAWATLANRRFTVEADSNRVGLRLRGEDGAGPLRADGRRRDELDSQGVVTGVVQVPPSGDPVILLPDHATLGGYPVLGVVATADHGLLGQCAPGTSVALVPIDQGAARTALAARRRAVATAVVGRYPLAVD